MIVFVDGRTISIAEPTSITLRKYGINIDEWKELVTVQGYKCPICKRPLEKRTNIDHYHVRHWNKMLPENRKLYIRGITDWYCNKNFLSKGISIERAKAIFEYLSDFEKRKPK